MEQINRRRLIKIHALLVVALLCVGSFVYGWLEDLRFIDALYSVVMIVTLVGSNRDPQTVAGKIFLMFVALASAGVFLSLVAQVFGPALASSLWKEWRMKKAVERAGHTILCGASYTSRALRARLSAADTVCCVRHEPEAVEIQDEGFTTIAGDFTTKKILEQAGIERAATLIAASEDDAENAFACLSAKLLNPKIRVVARVGLEEHREKLEEVGADVIVSPSMLAAEAILRGLEEVRSKPPVALPRVRDSARLSPPS